MVKNISLTAEMIAEACDVLLAQHDQRASVKYDPAFAYAGWLGPGIQEHRKDLGDVTPKLRIDAAQGG